MSTISNSEQSEPTAPLTISAADIAALLQIVDLASQRGAFRAPELTEIGKVYDKVSKFVQVAASTNAPSVPNTIPPVLPPMTGFIPPAPPFSNKGTN